MSFFHFDPQGLHCDFACLLYKYIEKKPTADRIFEIVDSAVNIEKAFFAEALQKPLGDMKLESMCKYIEFCADRLLRELGYCNRYNTDNPFKFIGMMSLEGKTNFFERRVGEYKKINAVNDTGSVLTCGINNELDLQTDF